MEWLLTGWISIELILFCFSFPALRTKVNNQSKNIGPHYLNTSKTIEERVSDYLKDLLAYCLLTGLIFYLLDYLMKDREMIIIEWCKGIFAASILPVIISGIQEKMISLWNQCLMFLGIAISVAIYVIDSGADEKAFTSINIFYLYLLLSFFLALLIVNLYKMFRLNTQKAVLNMNKRGVRKDLFYRTSNINTDINNRDLVKICEKYFEHYNRCYNYRNVQKIRKIEFVQLCGEYRTKWAKMVAKKFLILSGVSVGLVVLHIIQDFNITLIGNLIVILLFWINVGILKRIDLDFLCRIAIRVWYNEWGYCLSDLQKSKFVSNLETMRWRKEQKYMYCVLDIAALCRAFAQNDKINDEKKMDIIVNSFAELYEDINLQKKHWIQVLPLWIAALFKYDKEQVLDLRTASILKESCYNEEEIYNVKVFLQGFWVDMTRKMPNKETAKFLAGFMDEVVTLSIM